MFVGVVGPYFCIALLASAVHLFPGLTFVICNHQTNHVRSVTRLISLLLINMPLNFCLRLFLDLSFVYIEWCICFYSECLNFLSAKTSSSSHVLCIFSMHLLHYSVHDYAYEVIVDTSVLLDHVHIFTSICKVVTMIFKYVSLKILLKIFQNVLYSNFLCH